MNAVSDETELAMVSSPRQVLPLKCRKAPSGIRVAIHLWHYKLWNE